MVMIITTTIIIKSRGVRRAGQGVWYEWKRRESVQGFGGKAGRRETTWRPRRRWGIG
jgi:hypothetical protein